MRLLSGKSVSPDDVRPRVLKDRECGAFHYIFRISPNPQKVERLYLVSISKTLHPSGTSNHTTIFAKHGGGSVMAWDCLAASGNESLMFVDIYISKHEF